MVATETGFFSMVEAFLRQELLEAELGQMLGIAVRLHRPDLVELLLSCGASVHAVYFQTVLLNWHPEVTKIFLRYGADYKEGSPFAAAFVDCCRTAIGIFKTLLQKEPELISQANEALIEHARKNNKQWVNWMLWLGSDPRAEVAIDDDDEPTTALYEAAKYGRVDLLKRFKVDPKKDDLVRLIAAPADYPDRAIIDQEILDQVEPQVVESLEYLLSFGPDLQQPRESGWSIMGEFIRQIEWDGYHCYVFGTVIYPDRLMECVLCLAKHGLQWDGENLRDLRSALRRLEGQDKWEMLFALAKAKALTPKAFKALISSPAMRKLVKDHPDEKEVINEAAGIRFLNAMIVRSVRQGIRRPEEIAAKIGITEDEVKRRANRLIKAGYLVKWGRARYRIGPDY